MFTKEEFDSLEVGNELEAEPLLPGLTKEPVHLFVSEATEKERVFMATLYGITIGTWTCKLENGVLTWAI